MPRVKTLIYTVLLCLSITYTEKLVAHYDNKNFNESMTLSNKIRKIILSTLAFHIGTKLGEFIFDSIFVPIYERITNKKLPQRSNLDPTFVYFSIRLTDLIISQN